MRGLPRVFVLAPGDGSEWMPLAGTLAHSLAEYDLPAARDWAQSLPAGELQDRALHEVTEQMRDVLRVWREQEPEAARTMLESLPEDVQGTLR